MTFDRWLALANVAWPILVVVAGGAWRAFRRMERRLDSIGPQLTSIARRLGSIEQRQSTTEGVLRFHHQVLAWHDAAIEDLEQRKSR